MLYKDYLNAARKHNYTCQVLVEKLDNINEKREPMHYKCLLLNLYYLSGYIIECIVKYGIYSLIGYDRKEEVSKLNQDKLTYQDHIKPHKFERYTEYLNLHNKRINIPLINDNKTIEKPVIELYKEWDAKVRYSYDLRGKEKHHYLKFYQYAEEIFKIISDNVKG
jgi:hypothetical protein